MITSIENIYREAYYALPILPDARYSECIAAGCNTTQAKEISKHCELAELFSYLTSLKMNASSITVLQIISSILNYKGVKWEEINIDGVMKRYNWIYKCSLKRDHIVELIQLLHYQFVTEQNIKKALIEYLLIRIINTG